MEQEPEKAVNQATETAAVAQVAPTVAQGEVVQVAPTVEQGEENNETVVQASAEKPELGEIKNPIELVKVFWGEIRVAMILVAPTQLIQFFMYLFITDKYPSVNWPMFVVGVCLVGFVSFLILDKQAREEKGASAGAFEVAVGYIWILFTLVFSLLGMAGENLLNAVCKKSGCFAMAMGIGAFKDYALYILFEGIVMGTIVFFMRVSRRRKEMEAKKSASISIAKPKKR